MKNFTFIPLLISLSIYSNSFGKDEIKLPPMPGLEKDETLLGVDKNKNNVRDEIEHFIYNKLTKDPEVFKAYLMFAQSYINIIRFYPNIEKVRVNERERTKDGECLHLLEKSKNRLQKSTWLIEQIFNTPERSRVDSWYAENSLKIQDSYTAPDKIVKEKVCRF